MKTLRVLSLALAALSLSSCANYFIRKECEKVDWYRHGYELAMSGRRVTGDAQVDKCQKAEFDVPAVALDNGFKEGMSNYCKPETVYTTGKAGDTFNTDMCDPGQARYLKGRHMEGVRAYCDQGNGFNAGSSGKKYQGVCPAELEKAFMPEYKKGRKKYANTIIATSQAEMTGIDSRIRDLERDRLDVSYRRNMLRPPREIREKVYNASTGSYVEETKMDDPDSWQRSNLDNQINSLTSQIQEQRGRQDQLQSLIRSMQTELANLD